VRAPAECKQAQAFARPQHSRSIRHMLGRTSSTPGELSYTGDTQLAVTAVQANPPVEVLECQLDLAHVAFKHHVHQRVPVQLPFDGTDTYPRGPCVRTCGCPCVRASKRVYLCECVVLRACCFVGWCIVVLGCLHVCTSRVCA
jgi:hypothetical protein